MSIDAILLVGGEGTRLRPLTLTTPKPMLPVAGVPLVVHQLARARAAGATRVVLATSYQSQVFESLGDGSALDLALRYATETVPLGTGGGIRNAIELLDGPADEPVLVFNGDQLSGHDIAAQLRRHVESGAAVTLQVTRVADPRAYGCVPLDAQGWVTAFAEKSPQPVTDLINAGCYVFRRSVIEALPANSVISVERDVFPRLLADGARLAGYFDAGYWLDLGTPQDFVRGSRDLVLGVVDSLARLAPPGPALLLDGAQVAPSARVLDGSCIGPGARVGDGALVEGSVLFAGASVGPDAQVRGCVLGRAAQVGDGCQVVSAVLGDGSRLGAGNELIAGARLWPAAVIADRALRFSPG